MPQGYSCLPSPSTGIPAHLAFGRGAGTKLRSLCFSCERLTYSAISSDPLLCIYCHCLLFFSNFEIASLFFNLNKRFKEKLQEIVRWNLLHFFFLNRISCSPIWSKIFYVVRDDLSDFSTSASQVLELIGLSSAGDWSQGLMHVRQTLSMEVSPAWHSHTPQWESTLVNIFHTCFVYVFLLYVFCGHMCILPVCTIWEWVADMLFYIVVQYCLKDLFSP